MPFSDIYVSTFKNDTEYRQLLIQTAMALQTNKFIQVRVTGKKSWKKHLRSSNFKPVGWTSNPCWIHFSISKAMTVSWSKASFDCHACKERTYEKITMAYCDSRSDWGKRQHKHDCAPCAKFRKQLNMIKKHSSQSFVHCFASFFSAVFSEALLGLVISQQCCTHPRLLVI